jgi:uncharacterized membrane protein YfcA
LSLRVCWAAREPTPSGPFTAVTTTLLVVAGVAAGVVGVVGGLASLVSYPALLAAGLPPVVANMTNTVAMTAVSAGTVVGSQRELRGHALRVARLCGLGFLGGAGGAALLLNTEPSTFEVVVPYLIAIGAGLLLAREFLRRWIVGIRTDSPTRSSKRLDIARAGWGTAILAASVYAGYFGAGAGIIVLALLLLRHVDPYAVTNAIKTLVTGAANVVAALVYTVLTDIDWGVVAPLALGMFVGGALGPALVRRIPEKTLRRTVGLAGLVLAVWLAA